MPNSSVVRKFNDLIPNSSWYILWFWFAQILNVEPHAWNMEVKRRYNLMFNLRTLPLVDEDQTCFRAIVPDDGVYYIICSAA